MNWHFYLTGCFSTCYEEDEPSRSKSKVEISSRTVEIKNCVRTLKSETTRFGTRKFLLFGLGPLSKSSDPNAKRNPHVLRINLNETASFEIEGTCHTQKKLLDDIVRRSPYEVTSKEKAQNAEFH